MNKELESIVMATGDLPTMPFLAIKVLQLVEREETTADDIAKVILSDPAIAARVLKYSNSSYYGCQRKIQTVTHAVAMIGFAALKSIVVAASTKEVYRPFGLTEQMLWEHSFGAALAARTIAAVTRAVSAEEAFLAGLFHDLGKTVLNSSDRNQFSEVMAQCYNGGLEFSDIERSYYPFTHDLVGAYVVRKWNFPEVLVSAVMYHHNLQFVLPLGDTLVTNMTATVAFADLLCKKYGIGRRAPVEAINLADSDSVKILSIGEEALAEIEQKFTEMYEEEKHFFMDAV